MFTKLMEAFTPLHSKYRGQVWVKRQAFQEKPSDFLLPGLILP